MLDRLKSLKHFFINVSFHILGASLTLMALFFDGLADYETAQFQICFICIAETHCRKYVLVNLQLLSF